MRQWIQQCAAAPARVHQQTAIGVADHFQGKAPPASQVGRVLAEADGTVLDNWLRSAAARPVEHKVAVTKQGSLHVLAVVV